MLRRLIRLKLRREILVVSACLALAAGVLFARAYPALHDIGWVVLGLPLLFLSLRRHGLLAVLCLVVVFFLWGWQRGTVAMQKLAVHHRLQYQKVTLVGVATDEAVYGKQYQLEFVMRNVVVESPERMPLTGNITVRGFGEPAIYRGDTVRVSGKLYPTLGNSLGSVSFAELSVVRPGTSKIDTLRREFAAGMQSALPEPVASFALGLLIGQRTTLPEQTSEQLRHVGLTHVIAVSGYNLTIIVMACQKVFSKRSKFQAMAACLGLIGLFLLITGSSPPIVRASIISGIGLAAWYYGRSIHPLVLLLTGAAITVAANPIYLWGNVSWYLSFLAFTGVLLLAPLVTKCLYRQREPGMIASICIETICATILVLPYALFIFGEMSLVSLLANVLVVPLVPLAMLLGLFAGLGGLLLPVIAGWIAWPATVVLTYMLDIAALLSRIPGSYVTDIYFSWQALGLAYATIGMLMLVLRHRVRVGSRVQNSANYKNNQVIASPHFHAVQKPPT